MLHPKRHKRGFALLALADLKNVCGIGMKMKPVFLYLGVRVHKRRCALGKEKNENEAPQQKRHAVL